MRHSLLILVLLLCGCPGEEPSQASTSSPSPSPVQEVSGRFEVHLEPGGMNVSLEGSSARLEWLDKTLTYTLEPGLAEELKALCLEAAPLMVQPGDQTPGPGSWLSYKMGDEVFRYRPDSTGSDPTLEKLFFELRELVPGSEPVLEYGYAVGEVVHSDLEGGFPELKVGEQQYVLAGDVPEGLKNLSVLVAGRVSDAPSLGMTGPTFELTDIAPWPPVAEQVR